MTRTVVGALDVPCPTCKQPVGARCVYTHIGDRMGVEMTRSSHVHRVWAADDVQRMTEVLLEN